MQRKADIAMNKATCPKQPHSNQTPGDCLSQADLLHWTATVASMCSRPTEKIYNYQGPWDPCPLVTYPKQPQPTNTSNNCQSQADLLHGLPLSQLICSRPTEKVDHLCSTTDSCMHLPLLDHCCVRLPSTAMNKTEVL